MTAPLSWTELLELLLSGSDLSIAQAEQAMNSVMRAEVTPAQLAAFLIALRLKGEVVDEIVGFRDAILANAAPIEITSKAVDIVGTGGDRLHTVNISTMAAIVVAASGVPVIKHGNRAVSSSSGSSDVLRELGVNIDLTGDQISQVFSETELAFLWAAKFHPGFANAAGVRAELGVATVFNLLGPLCNPARPEASLVGVADAARAELIAGVFASRGATALVVRGDDGLDELSTTGHSHVWEISQGNIAHHDIDPADLGLSRSSLADLRGGNAAQNARIARELFAGGVGAVRDIVALNAAAAIVAFDLSQNAELAEVDIRQRLRERLQTVNQTIDSGAAERKLEQWASKTQSDII